jgi:protein-S-isoprenylcysteine O-methyltransferase Ste14
MNQSFQNQLFRQRSVLPIPFYIICLLFGQFNWSFFLSGFIMILIGEWIRFYSVGFIGKISRKLDQPAAKSLTISGPYHWVRNPIYSGNILIYLGFTLLSNVFLPYFPIITGILFFIHYSLIIRLEEKFLLQTFGTDYELYRQRVNRWIPVFRKTDYSKKLFQFITAWHSEKSTVFVLIAALILILFRMLLNSFWFFRMNLKFLISLWSDGVARVHFSIDFWPIPAFHEAIFLEFLSNNKKIFLKMVNYCRGPDFYSAG